MDEQLIADTVAQAVPRFVLRAVRAIDHHAQFNQFFLDLLAERIFIFARKILCRGHCPQQKVIGLFIDRQMLVLRQFK